MPLRRQSARLLLGAYLVVIVVLLVAEVFGSPLALVAGWFALPLLAELVVVSTDPPRPRAVVLVLVALACGFGAEVLTDLDAGDTGFPVRLALLALAHLGYVAALWPLRRESLAYTRSRWLVGYGLLFAILFFALRTGAGELLWPMVGYGVLVTAAAVLVSALGLSAAFGGAFLFLSSALMAMYRFVPAWDRPGMEFWILLTWLSAQLLIVLGVVQRWQGEPATVQPATPALA